MGPTDKLFRAIVLGGVALVAQADACGGTVSTVDAGDDAAQKADSFPSELPVQMESGVPEAGADATNDAPDDATDAFPSELPVTLDGG